MFSLEPDPWASGLNHWLFSLTVPLQGKGHYEMVASNVWGQLGKHKQVQRKKARSPQKQAMLQFSYLPPPYFPPASDGKHPKLVPL